MNIIVIIIFHLSRFNQIRFTQVYSEEIFITSGVVVLNNIVSPFLISGTLRPLAPWLLLSLCYI